MIIAMALVVAVLLGLSFYLLMQKTLSALLLGLLIFSNAANLLIFVAGGLRRAEVPLIGVFEGSPTDPLPQALILTAIVISMAVLAFMCALAFKIKKSLGVEHLDELKGSDQ